MSEINLRACSIEMIEKDAFILHKYKSSYFFVAIDLSYNHLTEIDAWIFTLRPNCQKLSNEVISKISSLNFRFYRFPVQYVKSNNWSGMDNFFKQKKTGPQHRAYSERNTEDIIPGSQLI